MDNTEKTQQKPTLAQQTASQQQKEGADLTILPPPGLLRRLRLAASRLESYSLRVQNALATGDREALYQALADVAEACEISRRLSAALLAFLQYTPPPEP